MQQVDVLIVGGGPAGLSSALYLGRARRSVLVVDGGAPRHGVSEGVHNFLTREGLAPADLRSIAWEQMAAYPSVTARVGTVQHLQWVGQNWEATLGDGDTVVARAVVLATGVIDEHPQIPGYAERWGRSIHHCPFCHGWELRERPLAALIDPAMGTHLPRLLRGWTDDVVVLTHGRPLAYEDAQLLEAAGIPCYASPIVALEGDAPNLATIVLEDGTSLHRSGLFVAAPQRQVPLVASLDLALTEQGYVQVDMMQRTSIPMLWAAGDLTSRMQQVVWAAAQGAAVAGAIQAAFVLQ